jgi:LAS superfamily LD-carboxypeptidase LdcB
MEKHVEDLAKHIHVNHLKSHKAVYFLAILFVALLGVLGWGYYEYDYLSKEFDEAQLTIETLNKNFKSLKEEDDYVKEKLLAEENKNIAYSAQIMSLAGTLGTLDKLANTDKELLQKYSKVYFLNEHYVPKKLVEISKEFVYDKTKTHQVNADVWPFFIDLMRSATSSGLSLQVVSAFRSFDNQSSLKTGYKVTYGAGTANKFSADQGYSEHQLGTAFDLTTANLGANFERFDRDPTYIWLVDNAYKYGFTLSYPPNNDYYQFEPWHWRFVGKALAERLHESNEYFYDFDQRKIDSYLITLFDQ